MVNLYLIAVYGLKVLKPKQALVQPTGNCNELNSYLCICVWFLYIWDWLRASFSQLRLISFIHFSEPCLYKFGQFLYNWGWFIQLWLIFIHLREVLDICGNLYIWESNTHSFWSAWNFGFKFSQHKIPAFLYLIVKVCFYLKIWEEMAMF